MLTIRPGGLTHEQQKAVADRIDVGRWIAVRPIRVIGPVALYWSFGKTVRVFRGRAVVVPRMKWVGTAPIPLPHHQGDEPR